MYAASLCVLAFGKDCGERVFLFEYNSLFVSLLWVILLPFVKKKPVFFGFTLKKCVILHILICCYANR